MPPLAYALCSFTHNLYYRVFPRLPPPAHQLPTNPQNQKQPSLRDRIPSLGSRLRRQQLCTSRMTSTPSSTQRLLIPLPYVCPIAIAMLGFDSQRYLRLNPAAMWPYTGKRYAHNLPTQPPATQQHSPHLAPPVPPPMPPPSYEEDSAQQQAQSRGYVYAYPQYYPGQVRYRPKFCNHIPCVLTFFVANDAWNGSAPTGFVHAVALHASYALPPHDASTER